MCGRSAIPLTLRSNTRRALLHLPLARWREYATIFDRHARLLLHRQHEQRGRTRPRRGYELDRHRVTPQAVLIQCPAALAHGEGKPSTSVVLSASLEHVLSRTEKTVPPAFREAGGVFAPLRAGDLFRTARDHAGEERGKAIQNSGGGFPAGTPHRLGREHLGIGEM